MNNNDNQKEEQLLQLERVAFRLNINRVTVVRLVKSGKLKGMKVGGQWRFKREWIDAYLNQQSVEV